MMQLAKRLGWEIPFQELLGRLTCNDCGHVGMGPGAIHRPGRRS